MRQRLVLGTFIVAGALSVAPAHAGLSNAQKQDAAAASAVLAGALAAGPVGALVGALGGSWIAGQVKEAGELSSTQDALAAREREVLALEHSLSQALAESEQYAQMALDHLELEMLFRTGESALTRGGVERLALLADFLRRNDAIDVRVDGFADPRGNAQDNLRLSSERADAVASQLVARGIAAERVVAQGHGASSSDAPEGDLDAYAMERVVRIELHRDGSPDTVAQVDISQ